ncbi:MAG: MBOAT family O-acyltransferase, partial [Thermoleophilia bacterium]
AGPIARASEFLPQLSRPRDPRSVDTSRAFFLIFGGLIKKMLIADYLATHIVNGVFTTPGQYSSLEVLVGIIGYSVQIYCDFSAYADIAIGISLLLGFELPDNFNAPYTATSVQDFWRRWHMTLSRWLRDYLYIPLGGNRRGRARTYLNLMITMVLGGLWHGAGWTFIFWGFLYGGAMIVEHARVDRRKDRALVVQRQRQHLAQAFEGIGQAAPLPEGPGAASAKVAGPPLEYDRSPWHGTVWPRIGVFAFVTFAWIFFRSDTLGAVVSVIARLFESWGSIGAAVTPGVLLAIVAGIGVQYVPRSFWQRGEAGLSVLNPVLQGVILAFGFMLLDILGPVGPAAFLYFKF